MKNFNKKIFYYFTNLLALLHSFNMMFVMFLMSWLFEWLFYFDYILLFYSSMYIYFPYKIPMLLLICLVFWLYVWGVSMWSSTQYGRFTSGDKKLWMKGFASFWIVEVVTLTGILLVSCWMSWGPVPMIPRKFWFPKKGFLFELTLLTYVMWLVYLMRFSLKWQLWRTQFYITLMIMLVLFMLMWRDLITLMFREMVSMDTGSNWRYSKISSIVYSMCSTWWLEYHLGHFYRDNYSYFSPIEVTVSNLLNHNLYNPFLFENVNNFTEFDSYSWLPINLQSYWWNNIGMTMFSSVNSLNPKYLYLYNDFSNYLFPPINLTKVNKTMFNYNSLFNNFTNDSAFFSPSKIGFLPKRIAMWFFLVLMKMWHHFMLFIWWFFYLLRLYSRRKSSYTMLSACYFNLYCCFIIGFLVYLYHVAPFIACLMKFRPYIQSTNVMKSMIWEAVNYVFDMFILEMNVHKLNHITLKEMAYYEFFRQTDELNFLGNSPLHKQIYYFNIMSDFILTHNTSLITGKKWKASVMFSNLKDLDVVSSNFFDVTLDFYTYSLHKITN